MLDLGIAAAIGFGGLIVTDAESSIDKAMRDAFQKMRHFFMTPQELEADHAAEY